MAKRADRFVVGLRRAGWRIEGGKDRLPALRRDGMIFPLVIRDARKLQESWEWAETPVIYELREVKPKKKGR